jgi:AraC-like DNA-binding protein
MSQQIIGIVNPSLSLMFCLSFLLFWRVQRHRSYILDIAFSYFAFACGIFISNVVIPAHSMFHVLAVHAFYSLAVILLIRAVSKRISMPSRSLLALSILVGITPLLVWLHSISNLANLRVIAANTAYAIILFIGAWNLWSGRKESKLDYWLFILFIAVATQFLVRPIIAFWLEGAVSNTDYRDSVYYSTFNLSMSLLSLLLAISLLAICALDYSKDIQANAQKQKTNNGRMDRDDELEKISDVMATNIHRHHELSINMLAEISGIQQHRLRKIINHSLGYKNFRDFLNSYRLKEAQALLTNPAHFETPITKIAFDCGFNSIPSFNRVFKVELGLTPSEFRERQKIPKSHEPINRSLLKTESIFVKFEETGELP